MSRLTQKELFSPHISGKKMVDAICDLSCKNNCLFPKSCSIFKNTCLQSFVCEHKESNLKIAFVLRYCCWWWNLPFGVWLTDNNYQGFKCNRIFRCWHRIRVLRNLSDPLAFSLMQNVYSKWLISTKSLLINDIILSNIYERSRIFKMILFSTNYHPEMVKFSDQLKLKLASSI